MLRITLEPAGDLTIVGQRWTALEGAARPGFFRSWTFIGCRAAERFAGAQLLSVTQDGADVALAIMGRGRGRLSLNQTGGRGRGRLWLNQTGVPAEDAVFIEHNGLLAAPGHRDAEVAALRHVGGRADALVLSGIDDTTLAVARDAGWLVLEQSRLAPRLQLRTLGARRSEGGCGLLPLLSANTRAQIGRAQRGFGPTLQLARAATQAEAQAWFRDMVALHQSAWTRRGQPGAFAGTPMRRFHAELIARAWPRGEAELLRITAQGRTVGILHFYAKDGRILSYQSGFDYDWPDRRAKPGLVCHALAIEHFAAAGATIYDLLAGADRYKLSLAPEGEMLHWATLHRPWSPHAVFLRMRQSAGACAGAIRAWSGPRSPPPAGTI